MIKELLSPAGSFASLKQAIHNGCDAVYLGGKNFGARKFATNFDNLELVEAVKYCHLYDVKIYVTVNTIIYDKEVNDFIDYVTYLHKIGVDAVIMQDVGMIYLVRKVLPNLDIHVSTQAHVHNLEQIKFYQKLGVKRVVIAREVSLSEINKFDTSIEIEAFIHGALCICYSGQCLFSSLLLNRSGNRGECAGICRLPFKLIKNGKELDNLDKYLLSPKELNTMDHVKELLDSNITSFKIEGRMKPGVTIGYITKLYRYLFDHYKNNEPLLLTEKEKDNLYSLFNRKFTSGYLFNNNYKEIINQETSNHIGLKIGKVISFNNKKIKIKLDNDLNQEDGIRFKKTNLGLVVNYLYDKKDNLINSAKKDEIVYVDNKIGLNILDDVYKTTDSKLIKELENYCEKRIPISFKALIKDNYILLTVSDGKNTLSNKYNIVEDSIKSETTKERIINQLSKLGNTCFKVISIDIDIIGKKFIPISKLNEIRRDLLLELKNVRENKKKDVIINDIFKVNFINSNTKPKLNVLVRTKPQLEAAINNKVDNIYIDNLELYNKYKDIDNVYLRLNRVINKYNDYTNNKLLVGEVGSLNKYNNSTLNMDYFLNVTNSYNIDLFRKLNSNLITLSIENNIDNIKSIIKNTGNINIEVIIYARIEVMISKFLLFNDDNNYMLKDRNNSLYPLIIKDNLMHVYNYKNYVLDDIKSLKEINVNNYRIDFFDEDYMEANKIINKYRKEIL